MKKGLSIALALILLAGMFSFGAIGSEIENRTIVTITMADGDAITLELFPQYAPNTVANFLCLIEQGFYDGLTFHRVIHNFIIQGGCPYGTGAGGAGHTINCESNRIPHVPGVISMAHAGPNTGSSQFFIVHRNPAPWLDGVHTAFGQVILGMDVVNRIAETATGVSDRPIMPQVIATITIDSLGQALLPPSTSPSIPTSPDSSAPTLWWSCLPNWAQWTLRYVFFGWIWM